LDLSWCHRGVSAHEALNGALMAVSHRHLDRLVPHELRDGAQINPGHHKFTGEGMPVAMPCVIFQLRRFDGRLEPITRATQFAAVRVQENETATGSAPVLGLNLELVEGSDCDRVQRDMPDSAILCLWQSQHAALEVNLIPSQAELFPGPHSCVNAQIEGRDVLGIFFREHGEQCRFLFRAQKACPVLS